MFAASRRAAVGVAVLSAGVAVPGTAGAAPEPSADPEAPRGACAIRALTPAEVARGEQSRVRCAPTREAARAAIDAEAGGAGEVSSFAQAAEFTIGYFFRSPRFDDVPLEVRGSSCAAVVNPVPAPYANDLSAGRLVGCSVTKMYKGRDFTGAMTSYRLTPGTPSSFSLHPDFDNQIRSISFGA